MRSVLDTDSSVAMRRSPRPWSARGKQRLDVAVRGSRELTLTLDRPNRSPVSRLHARSDVTFIRLLYVCSRSSRSRAPWPQRLLASGPTFWTSPRRATSSRARPTACTSASAASSRAGPQLTNRLTTSTPAQIWSLAAAPDGTLWAGTGGDGRVIRLRPGQREETVFDARETNVFAIAVAGTRVYAATGPDGKVYAIEGDGTARPFFDPQEKYIWALAVDRQDGCGWAPAIPR